MTVPVQYTVRVFAGNTICKLKASLRTTLLEFNLLGVQVSQPKASSLFLSCNQQLRRRLQAEERIPA